MADNGITRRNMLKVGAAGAAMSTFPLVNVHGQSSGGKLALGFWDHWVGATANEEPHHPRGRGPSPAGP